MTIYLIRGGYRSRDCWSWRALAGGVVVGRGRSWWLHRDDAVAEAMAEFPGAEVAT